MCVYPVTHDIALRVYIFNDVALKYTGWALKLNYVLMSLVPPAPTGTLRSRLDR